MSRRDRHVRRRTSQQNPTPGRYAASEQPDPWWDDDDHHADGHAADDHQDGDDLDQVSEC